MSTTFQNHVTVGVPLRMITFRAGRNLYSILPDRRNLRIASGDFGAYFARHLYTATIRDGRNGVLCTVK